MPSEGGVFSFSFDEPEHVGTLVDWIFAKDPCGSDLKTADWIEMCHMNTFGTGIVLRHFSRRSPPVTSTRQCAPLALPKMLPYFAQQLSMGLNGWC